LRRDGDGSRRYYYRRKKPIFENGSKKYRDIRVSLGTSLERAMLEARKLDGQHDAERNGEKPRREVTVKAFADWYVGHARDERRLLSWKTIRGSLKALLAHFGDVPLRRITRPDIERFLNRRTLTVRASTANANLRDAKRMFNVAIDEGCLESNPAVRVKLLRAQRLPVRLPTPEEVGLVLDNLKRTSPWQYPLVLILVGTGCRLAEALGLDWSDIDFNREVMNLRRRKANDILPIPLKGMLKDALWELWMARGMPREGRVLLNAKGKPCGRFTGHSAFKRTAKRLGMPWLTLRTFRKFAATTVAEKTGDVRLAQQLLGHSNIRTTELYLGRADEARKKAVETMADLLSGLGGTVGGTAAVLTPREKTGEAEKTIV
jgi:integrase